MIFTNFLICINVYLLQGGDGSTQENDAEIDNFGNSRSGDVTIEGSDKCNRNDLNFHPNAVGPNVTKATFLIGNQYYRITNDAGLDKELCHNKCLFALAGQPDSEGPVNEEIFLAFNRVVNGNYYRIGYGTCTAKISWECPRSVISAGKSNYYLVYTEQTIIVEGLITSN